MHISIQFCALAFIFWIEIVHCVPLFQGFSVQKGFEVKLQPFQFKPFSIFKEKWSPFGRFGTRKGIQKRDLGTNNEEMSPAPVFEVVDEGEPITNERPDNIDLSATLIDLERIKPISSNLIRIPLTEDANSFRGLYTNVNRDAPANNKPQDSEPVIAEVYGELPPRINEPVPDPNVIVARQTVTPVPSPAFSPVPMQPINPVTIQPVHPFVLQSVTPRPFQPISLPQLQPVSPVPIQPTSPIPVQQINPVPIQSINPVPIQPINPVPTQPINPVLLQAIRSIPLQPVTLTPAPLPIPMNPIPIQAGLTPGQGQPQGAVTLITPPPRLLGPPSATLSEIPPTDGPLIRGSKKALYYGNVLVQLISQFLTNARMQISRMRSSAVTPPASDN